MKTEGLLPMLRIIALIMTGNYLQVFIANVANCCLNYDLLLVTRNYLQVFLDS